MLVLQYIVIQLVYSNESGVAFAKTIFYELDFHVLIVCPESRFTRVTMPSEVAPEVQLVFPTLHGAALIRENVMHAYLR